MEKVFGGFPDVPPVAPQVRDGLGRAGIRSAPQVRVRARLDLVGRHRPSGTTRRPLSWSRSTSTTLATAISGRRPNGFSTNRRSFSFCELRASTTRHRQVATARPPVTTRPNGPSGSADPMLGQWVVDVRRLHRRRREVQGSLPKEVVLIGKGRGGLVALCAAAVDPRVTKVATIGALASYVTDQPYVGAEPRRHGPRHSPRSRRRGPDRRTDRAPAADHRRGRLGRRARRSPSTELRDATAGRLKRGDRPAAPGDSLLEKAEIARRRADDHGTDPLAVPRPVGRVTRVGIAQRVENL